MQKLTMEEFRLLLTDESEADDNGLLSVLKALAAADDSDDASILFPEGFGWGRWW